MQLENAKAAEAQKKKEAAEAKAQKEKDDAEAEAEQEKTELQQKIDALTELEAQISTRKDQ